MLASEKKRSELNTPRNLREAKNKKRRKGKKSIISPLFYFTKLSRLPNISEANFRMGAKRVGPKNSAVKRTTNILGTKERVCSWIDVAVCKIPTANPTMVAAKSIGKAPPTAVHIALLNKEPKEPSITRRPPSLEALY